MCEVITDITSKHTKLHFTRESNGYSQETESINGRKLIIEKNVHDNDGRNTYTQTWSTRASIGDVVCIGATFIIVIIQLCVLIFYVFKDHESIEVKT